MTNKDVKKRVMDAIKAGTIEQEGYGVLPEDEVQGEIETVGEVANESSQDNCEVPEEIMVEDTLTEEEIERIINEEIDEALAAGDYGVLSELPEYIESAAPVQFKAKKIAQRRAQLYLWGQNVVDIFRNRRKKVRARKEAFAKDKAVKREVKKAVKQSRAAMRDKAREITKAEREKLYNQFVNHLILLLINGIAVGGLLLAGMDYLLTAQIPERHPVVLLLFLGITIYCAFYWCRTFKNGKGIEGVRGLASFAMIICLIGTAVGGYDMYHNTVNLNTFFNGERIIIKDKKNTATILAGYIEKWRHTPNYCLVHVSDTAYYATVYNSQGESITQLVQYTEDGEVHDEDESIIKDIAICLKDSTAVIVTADKIERRRDVDNLRYVELALQWAAKGKANIERISPSQLVIPKSKAPEDAMPGTEYVVIINGLSKIKEFYATVLGVEAAEDMFRTLTAVGSRVELTFHVAVDNNYLGVAALIKVDGEENLLWYIDNYTEVYDWSLGTEDWYRYDFSDAKKNEKMIQEAVYNATSMLTQFGLDTGLVYIDDDTSKTGTDEN